MCGVSDCEEMSKYLQNFLSELLTCNTRISHNPPNSRETRNLRPKHCNYASRHIMPQRNRHSKTFPKNVATYTKHNLSNRIKQEITNGATTASLKAVSTAQMHTSNN